jgi:hypothetical protein
MLAILLASILIGTNSPETTDDAVAAMMSRDAERLAALHGHTAMRRYELENRGRHKRAEMLVKVTAHEDARGRSKLFPRVVGAWY